MRIPLFPLLLAVVAHGDWRPVYQGVEMDEWTKTEPRQIAAYLVKIDLQAKGVRVESTAENGPRPGETDARKTSTFLTQGGYEMAVNAAPFDPVAEKEGAAQDVVGLEVFRGETVSPGLTKFPALVITRDGHARVERNSAEPGRAWMAVGGFSTVLWRGKVVPRSSKTLHPRTAAGVTADGRYLILLIVDGRQPGYSMGATERELGQWLLEAGCTDGINLDGGGSTTLVRERRAEGKGPLFLNRPIHSLFHRERVVGSHLGVDALPLEN